MEIQSTLTNRSNQTLKVIYREDDPLKNLDGKILQAVHAYCFYNDQLVIVYAKEKGSWTPPGGGIEQGETYTEAVVREVAEETNMKVLYQELIGYQDIFEPDRIVRQTRSFCIVEPMGDFSVDPDGDVTEIKLIDQSDIKNYFDWGIVGNRLITRALEIKEEMKGVKTLKFAPHLVPLVISGEKISTWRLFDDKNLRNGDSLVLLEKTTCNAFARATIVSTKEKKLKNIQESDFEGHERFESKEKMYEAYRNYYGDKVTPDVVVKMIKFEVQKKTWKGMRALHVF